MPPDHSPNHEICLYCSLSQCNPLWLLWHSLTFDDLMISIPGSVFAFPSTLIILKVFLTFLISHQHQHFLIRYPDLFQWPHPPKLHHSPNLGLKFYSELFHFPKISDSKSALSDYGVPPASYFPQSQATSGPYCPHPLLFFAWAVPTPWKPCFLT